MELDVFHLFLWEPIAFEGTIFEINRVVLLMYFAALVTVGFFMLGIRKRSLVPRGFQFAAETGYLFVRNNIAIDIMGPQGARYAPFLTCFFFFIFFSNFLEILPFVNFPVTSRMALPGILALTSWFAFVGIGLKRHGFSYLKDIAFPPGVPAAVYIILTPIELLSTFIIRPFTLAIRLLANMLAGHVLLTIFFLFTEELLLHGSLLQRPLGIVTFLVAIILIVFELLVITIQAYIFTTLTAFYIAEALEGHGEEVHVEAGHPEPIRETEMATT